MFYSLERRGHRDGYNMPDVDGEKLRDDERRKEQGDDWIWAGMPPELETDLDLRDVLNRWRQYSSVCDPSPFPFLLSSFQFFPRRSCSPLD